MTVCTHYTHKFAARSLAGSPHIAIWLSAWTRSSISNDAFSHAHRTTRWRWCGRTTAKTRFPACRSPTTGPASAAPGRPSWCSGWISRRPAERRPLPPGSCGIQRWVIASDRSLGFAESAPHAMCILRQSCPRRHTLTGAALSHAGRTPSAASWQRPAAQTDLLISGHAIPHRPPSHSSLFSAGVLFLYFIKFSSVDRFDAPGDKCSPDFSNKTSIWHFCKLS